MPKRRVGFTFVEILVALLVFSVLSAIAVPRYRLFKERAYVATLKSDLGNLRIAQEAYWSENLVYATDTASLDWKSSSQVKLAISAADPAAGFTAIASHDNMPQSQCVTYVGRDATTAPSGEIVCGAGTVAGGSALAP
jgi:prepilin-type N-terminal cleavage/methylation domain-containing protein